MPSNPDFGRRLRDARRDWEKAHDADLSYREIGERVAAIVGREPPFSHQAVRKWFEGGQEPQELGVVLALAKVLGADPAALAWGAQAPTTSEPPRALRPALEPQTPIPLPDRRPPTARERNVQRGTGGGPHPSHPKRGRPK